MKKIFVALLAVAVLAAPSFAKEKKAKDKGLMVKGGFGYGILLSPDADSGGGLSLGAQVLSDKILDVKNLKVGGEIGYQQVASYDVPSSINFLTGQITYESKSVSAVPILAVAEYDLSDSVKLGKGMSAFAQFGLGLSAVSFLDDSEMDFTLMIGPGVRYDTGEDINIEATMKYYSISTEGDSSSLLNIGVAGVYQF